MDFKFVMIYATDKHLLEVNMEMGKSFPLSVLPTAQDLGNSATSWGLKPSTFLKAIPGDL